MCDASLLFIGGTVMSAYSSYAQGQAMAQAAAYNAQIAQNRAAMLERQAQDVDRVAGLEKRKLNREYAKVVGKGRTGFAAGNVKLGSGSPLSWEMDVAGAQEEDIITLDYNAELKKWGIRSDAALENQRAGLARLEGKNARRAGNIGAFTTLLGGAAEYNMRF